jgi:hypothetical protein
MFLGFKIIIISVSNIYQKVDILISFGSGETELTGHFNHDEVRIF